MTIDWSLLYKEEPLEKIQADWVRRVWNGFKEFIPPRARLLEIGCGTGKFVVLAAKELDCAGVGIDIDPDSSRYASYLAGKLGVKNRTGFLCGDGFSLPFPDETFDVVMSEGVIEHFTTKQEVELLKEHRRVCKQGGIILVSVPNLLCIPHTFCKLLEGKRFHVYPEKSHSHIGLLYLFHMAKIEILGFSGFNPSGFVFEYRMKYPLFRYLARIGYKLNVIKPRVLRSIVGFQILAIGRPR